MKLNRKSGAKLAMIAAVLVVTGATLIGAAMADTVKGRCFGVNGCKGQGNCKRGSPRLFQARGRSAKFYRVFKDTNSESRLLRQLVFCFLQINRARSNYRPISAG
jgi:hypothetical protein